ncbi:MAG: hypothetical protein A3J75_00545 [Acidobacteria bacterium RBG_16_68_9]|nr:MAG: hypothetical protein A3J75_00545 [Acidobacteria bacterium RBG_16_68_9]
MTDKLDAIFVRLPPSDIALMKFLFESYEGIAVVRTMDRHRAVIVVLVSHDFLEVARGILDSLRDTIAFEQVPPPGDADEDWLVRLLREDVSDRGA